VITTNSDKNGTTPHKELASHDRLLSELEALPEDLSPPDKLIRYQILRPELADLYEANPVAFDLIAKEVASKLGVKRQTVQQDSQAMIPPAEEPALAGQLEKNCSQASNSWQSGTPRGRGLRVVRGPRELHLRATVRCSDKTGGVTGGFHDQCVGGQTADGTVVTAAA
jgi:hypothetical protein